MKNLSYNLKIIIDLLRIPATLPQLLIILLGYLIVGGKDSFIIILGILSLGPLIYGGVYIMNSIMDVEEDAKHPTKKKRPLPSKKISIKKVFVLMIFLFIIGLTIAWFISKTFFIISCILIINNFCYSVWPRFKDIPLLDVILISMNYPLRFIAGASIFGLNSRLIIPSILIYLITLLAFTLFRLKERNTGDNRKIFKNLNSSKTLKLTYSIFTGLIVYLLYLYLTSKSLNSFIIILLLLSIIITFLVILNLVRKNLDFDHMINPLWTFKNQRKYIFVSILYIISGLLLIFTLKVLL